MILKALSLFAVSVFLAGIHWSWGKRLLGVLGPDPGPGPLRFCLRSGLGILFVTTFWTGLGFLGLWNEGFLLAVLAALSVPWVLDLWSGRQGLKIDQFPSGKTVWFLVPCVFALGFPALHALLPETFYDPLNYVLGLPAFWLGEGGIVDHPFHLKSGYPYGGSLLFLGGYLLAGTEGARMSGVLVLAWIFLAVYGWGRALAGPWAGTCAAAAAAAFPPMILGALSVRVDLLAAFVLLLVFYGLSRAIGRSAPSGWLVVSGLLAGFALAVKPTAGAALAAGFLAWVSVVGTGRGFLRHVGFFLVPALVATSPWAVKNLAFAGNPAFPYLPFLGGREVPDAGLERLLWENHRFLPMDHGVLSLLDLPWRLTMPGAGDDQFMGPLLLAFLPALLLLRPGNGVFRFLWRSAILALVLGFVSSHMVRYSLAAFLLAFLCLCVGLAGRTQGLLRGLWSGAILACALLLAGSYSILSLEHYQGAGVWCGREDRAGYLERTLPHSYMGLATWIERNLPKEAKVLVVGDSRGVHYPPGHWTQSVFDEPFLEGAARDAGGPEGIQRRLREAGFTHLAVNTPEGFRTAGEYGHYRLEPAEWRKLDEFVVRGLEPLVWMGTKVVYRIRPGWGPRALERPFDPFSLFSTEAHDYFRAQRRGDALEAARLKETLRDLFPGDPFWRGS